MCPNKCIRLLFLLAALALGQAAQAAPRTLALLLGDVESRPAVLAVHALAVAVTGGGYLWRRRAVTFGTDSGR